MSREQCEYAPPKRFNINNLPTVQHVSLDKSYLCLNLPQCLCSLQFVKQQNLSETAAQQLIVYFQMFVFETKENKTILKVKPLPENGEH